jgi:prevent-host-death family protein
MGANVRTLSAARADLSRLIARASRGEEIIITKHGRPVARLVPMGSRVRRRTLGGWEGRGWLADDFDAPLPDEIMAGFEGRRP